MMLIAPATSPAFSRDSYTVAASAERCFWFIEKIVSMTARENPAALIAANEEPYSTRRRSCRSYQTRCGMWCTPGPPPVAIDDRQTGVRDGKTETALP